MQNLLGCKMMIMMTWNIQYILLHPADAALLRSSSMCQTTSQSQHQWWFTKLRGRKEREDSQFRVMMVLNYSDSKHPFHTNLKCSVRSALPYSMGILLRFGGVIYSTYPWLQDCSLGHVVWATGCRDMINLNSNATERVFFTFEMKRVFVYYQYLV